MKERHLCWETLALVAAATALVVLLPASFVDRGHWERAAAYAAGRTSSSASGGAAVVPNGSGGAAHAGGAPIDGAASAETLAHSGAGNSSGNLAFQLSGYSSRGKVKAWRGDVATNDALKEAVASLAYKSELVLIFSHNQDGLDMAMNSALSLHALGIDHVFILVSDSAVCTEHFPAVYANTSCWWDTTPYPDNLVEDKFMASQNMRWRVVARLLRLGVNVLSMDSDTVVAHDPYLFYKRGEFQRMNFISQRDGPDGAGGVNCGVTYWQNLDPSGPMVWMVVTLIERLYRLYEGAAWLEENKGESLPGEHAWEQAAYNDLLDAMLIGRPTFRDTWASYYINKGREDWLPYHDMQHKQDLQALDVQLLPEWQEAAGKAEDTWWVAHLALPSANGTWPEEFGGRFYPPERGNCTSHWMELVRSLNPKPLWPDDEEVLPANYEPPREWFMFAPSWMVSMYNDRGARGYWAHRPPKQVIMHDVYLVSPEGTTTWKRMVYKGFHLWNWEVDKVVLDGRMVPAAPPAQLAPRMLALEPGLALNTTTELEFRNRTIQLIALATQLNRTLVVPEVWCDSWWAAFKRRPTEDRATIPYPLFNYLYEGWTVLAFPDSDAALEPVYCSWTKAMTANCLTHIVVPPDSRILLQTIGAAPTPQNTLFAGASPGSERPRVAGTVQLTFHDFVEQAQQLDDQQVVFLGADVHITDTIDEDALPEAYQELRQGCWLFQQDMVTDMNDTWAWWLHP